VDQALLCLGGRAFASCIEVYARARSHAARTEIAGEHFLPKRLADWGFSRPCASMGCLAKTPLVPMATARLHIRIILANGAILGPTKIAVLEAIVAGGSIHAAARSLGISYRYVWQSVQAINDMLCSPAVVTEVGGHMRDGAKLTATGKQVVAIYHAIQSQADTASFHELQALVTMSRKHQPSTRAAERLEKI
jgi:molybdate transport system regulatory protein